MRAVSLLGALSAAALLAACSSGPGPLGDGGSGGQQCMAVEGFAPGQPVTTGIYDLHNMGSAPVTVTSVTLPDAHGLTMTKAWLVPIGDPNPATGGGMLVGAGWPYPPAFDKLVRSVWAQRRPAVGTTIKPGQDLNLVFGLIWTGARAGLSPGPVISYRAGRSYYSVAEQTSLAVAAKC